MLRLSDIPDDYVFPNMFYRRGLRFMGQHLKLAASMFVLDSGLENSEGLCDVTSEAFKDILVDYWHVPARVVRVRRFPYPVPRGTEHYAVRIGKFYVDFTANQFDPKLPTPVIWATKR